MDSDSIIQALRSGGTDPRWWAEKLSLRDGLMQLYYLLTAPEGVDIPTADWDTLIILDACRYDLFEQENTIQGRLKPCYSKGSSTLDFLEGHFVGKHGDTVYVTANTRFNIHVDDAELIFHDVVNVWEYSFDDELRTVPPDAMREAVIEAHRAYPNKRIIAHFVQPHYPFIGEKGQRLPAHKGFERDRNTLINTEHDTAVDIWDHLEAGDVTAEEVWGAYRENLKLTLPEVEALIEAIDGKVIVTSDHGNMIGEYAWPWPVSIYGHPSRIRHEKLIKVPWLECPYEVRREVVDDGVETHQDLGSIEMAKDRLRDLGYAE